jgi:hypothetical protein
MAQGSSLRSPEVLTPSLKRRDAEEEDHEVSTHTSWGGRGKRGVPPAAAAESVPNKRKRVQVSLLPQCQLLQGPYMVVLCSRFHVVHRLVRQTRGVCQARLQFLDESPKDMRRRGLMDAGDADGADALLSLAAMTRDADDDNLPGLKLPASAQRELEEKLESLAAQAVEAGPCVRDRPKRNRTTPAKVDVCSLALAFSCR